MEHRLRSGVDRLTERTVAMESTLAAILTTVQHLETQLQVSSGTSASAPAYVDMGNAPDVLNGNGKRARLRIEADANVSTSALPDMLAATGDFDVKLGPANWSIPKGVVTRKWKNSITNSVLAIVRRTAMQDAHFSVHKHGKDHKSPYITLRFKRPEHADLFVRTWHAAEHRMSAYPGVFATRLT
ncbi:hypothetical protein C8F01DRAFT_1370289 [Mycena amicta]|nr:hypothetical protein C8F01DRAFT_1370289 [Mycena amicta]